MPTANYVCLSEVNQREDNQDSYLIVEFTPCGARAPLLLLTVADGMGGYEHGAQVSREVLRRNCLALFQQLTIEPALNANGTGSTFGLAHLAAALTEAAALVDDYVRRLVETNNWRKAGTTIVVAAVYEDEVVALNLGDSPLFHYEWASHTLRQLTEDHTMANALVRGGLITAEMARYHEGNSQLEFYVGGGALPQPAPVHYRKLAHGDLLLLCTDGISKLLGLEKMNELLRRMASVVSSSHGLANLAEALREAAVAAGEADNQTLILWRYLTHAALPAGDSPLAPTSD
jgi:serine/threonine protein phosphatase PrpC